MSEVVAHVSPYKRIEIGPRATQQQPAPTESIMGQAINAAKEELRRIEYLRIWNHVVQTAQGCNAPASEVTR